MHPRAAEFAERAAEEYDFDVEVHEFPEGTKTAADAADAVDCAVAQIGKSIVMTADREDGDADLLEPSRRSREADLVVVLTSGDHRVDEEALADELDAESVESASPSEVRETLGWSIGGVPPFCHDADVETLFDTSLTDYEEIWCAAGTPDAVFPIDPDRLRELADARPTTAVE